MHKAIQPKTNEKVILDSAAGRLKKNIKNILDRWMERADKEIRSAEHQSTLALQDSLPEFLNHLVTTLSKTINRTATRIQDDKDKSTSLGKEHGRDRAGTTNYTLEQLIREYHILRQVIEEVFEEEEILTSQEREIIVGSIEQAVNDAAVEFSHTLKDIQEQMSYTLAHDLRTPITSAKMNAQLSLRKIDDKDFCAQSLQKIANSMDRLDKMIGDLLDAGLINSGKGLQLDFKNCDLNIIIRNVVGDFFSDNQLIVKSETCMGHWNHDGLRRTIENLMNNAVKYGEENAPITITLTQDSSQATVEVHNEGLPIPADDRANLFDKFQRAPNAQGKVGWGLGLTVVKGMIEAHHGTVQVRSESGKGTSFLISIPKKQEIVHPEVKNKIKRRSHHSHH